jgi:hypothetical protein
MIWATRPQCHVDRIGSAWLIRRFIDPVATFVFVEDSSLIPDGAIGFDMRGVKLSHRNGDCSFETIVRQYELTDPVLSEIAEIVHEADLSDDRFGGVAAPGLDLICRGLAMTLPDSEALQVGAVIFDGLYAFTRGVLLNGTQGSDI